LEPARPILHIFQFYRNEPDTKCSGRKFFHRFVTDFDDNLRRFKLAVLDGRSFQAKGGFLESVWGSGGNPAVFISNWGPSRSYLEDVVARNLKDVVGEYAERASIVANFVDCTYKLSSAILNKSGWAEILLLVNSFRRSLDFTNIWAQTTKTAIYDLFGGFVDTTSFTNFLTEGLGFSFPTIDSLYYKSTHVAQKGWKTGYKAKGFQTKGLMEDLNAVAHSDLAALVSRLAALASSAILIMSLKQGEIPPKMSLTGLTSFAASRAGPILASALVAGTFPHFVEGLALVVAATKNCTSAIFHCDMGRFCGLNPTAELEQFFFFINNNYETCAPVDSRGIVWCDREDCFSPVTKRLPTQVYNSTNEKFIQMRRDLEGGDGSSPMEWSDGLCHCATVLAAVLQDMLSKGTGSPATVAAVTRMVDRLITLSKVAPRSVSFRKAEGLTLIISGAAGVGKSTVVDKLIAPIMCAHIVDEGLKPDIQYPALIQAGAKIGYEMPEACVSAQSLESEYINYKQRGVPVLLVRKEDPTPLNPDLVTPTGNIVHTVMNIAETTTSLQPAAALTSLDGGATKDDNYFTPVGGIITANDRCSYGDLFSIHFPAFVRRIKEIRVRLDKVYANNAGGLDKDHPKVAALANTTDNAKYQLFDVITEERALNARDTEWSVGELMVERFVTHKFAHKWSIGLGEEKITVAAGDTLLCKDMKVNLFCAWLNDVCKSHYSRSFRAWRNGENQHLLRSPLGICPCEGNSSYMHCPYCASTNELCSKTGYIAQVCPCCVQTPPDPALSVIRRLKTVTARDYEQFRVLIASGTFRPVLRSFFRFMKVHEIMAAQNSSEPWSFGLCNGNYAESGVLTTAFDKACRTQDQTAKKYSTWWDKQYPGARPLLETLTLFFFTIIYTPYEADAMFEIGGDFESPTPFQTLAHILDNCTCAASVERAAEPPMQEADQSPREQARKLALAKLMFVNYVLGIPSPSDQARDHGYLSLENMLSGAAAFSNYCGVAMEDLHSSRADLYDHLGFSSCDALKAFVELLTPRADDEFLKKKPLRKQDNTVMPRFFMDSVHEVMCWPSEAPVQTESACGWASESVEEEKADEDPDDGSDDDCTPPRESDDTSEGHNTWWDAREILTKRFRSEPDPQRRVGLAQELRRRAPKEFQAKMFATAREKATIAADMVVTAATGVAGLVASAGWSGYDDNEYEEIRETVTQSAYCTKADCWYYHLPAPFLFEDFSYDDTHGIAGVHPPQKSRGRRVANWVKGVLSDFRLSFVNHYFPSMDPQLRKACVIAGGTAVAAVFGFQAYKFIEAMIPTPAVVPEVVPAFVPKGDVDKSTHAISTPWWDIGSSGAERVFGPNYMNKFGNVTKTSHGMVTLGKSGCIQHLLGSKTTNRASRCVKLEMKVGCGIRKIRALALDSKSFIAPAHFFADVFPDLKILDLQVHTTRSDTGHTVTQLFSLTKDDISFGDGDADLVRIAHGLDSLQFAESAPMYKKKLTEHVNLSGYTCFERQDDYDVAEVSNVSNCHPQMMMIGEDRMIVPENSDSHEMLKGKPMMNTVCYRVDGASTLLLGDCGSPIILNNGPKGNFPAIGMYIGTSRADGTCYETFVMLSEEFMIATDRDLFQRVLSEPVLASTIGAFAELHEALAEPEFDAKMDVVVRYGEPKSAAHVAMIAKAKVDCKLRAAVNKKGARKDKEWPIYMPGANESEINAGYHLDGKDNDLRTYSGHKPGSGDNVALPTFDESVISGIFSELPGVKALRAPITSKPTQVFNPILFFLGIAPWAGDRHPDMSTLLVGLVGPGVPGDEPGRSITKCDLGPEVAKTFVGPNIPRWIVRKAGSYLLAQKRKVIKNLRPGVKVDDMASALRADIIQMFLGIKRPDGSNVYKPLDRSTSWGSIFKPEFGSGTKNDVVCTTESGDLGIVPGAEDTWLATTAATFLITMGFLPVFMLMTVFCKDELYAVEHKDPLAEYPDTDDMVEFYSKLYGIEKDDKFFDLELGDDDGYRDFFETRGAPVCKVKVKTRAVFCLPAPVNLAIRMFFMPLLYLTAEYPIHFDLVSSLDMDGPHYEQSMMDLTVACWDRVKAFPRFFDADVSAWDKTMPYSLSAETLLVMIELVIDEHIHANTYNHQIRVYAWTLLRWWANTAVFYSSLIFMISVMPSGLVITLLLNSFMNQVLMYAVVIDFCHQHSIPLPECLSEFVLHQSHGDDSRTGVTPLFVKACRKAGVKPFCFTDYQGTMGKYGILATLASKGSEAASPYQKPEDIVFLQHSGRMIHIPAYSYADCLEEPLYFDQTVLIMAAPLGSTSLIKMLGAWETKSPLEDSELLFQEMRAQVYQSIPYGKEHFTKLRNRVLAFNHPKYKPESTGLDVKYAELFDWNIALSWYVEKFCKDGRLCPRILKTREKHKLVHDATFTLLGSKDAITLSYERV